MSEPRPPLVTAMEWTSRITTISLELVLPILGGYWLDHRLGTRVLFVIVGVILGFSASLWSLLRLVKPTGINRDPDR